MGYLYYGNYALYYEVGRTDAIRQLGFTYRELEEKGILMPVVEFHTQFLRPAYYDDLLTVHTCIKELDEEYKIQFHTEIYNEKNKLLNKGITTLVFVDALSKKKTVMPELLRERLTPYFN